MNRVKLAGMLLLLVRIGMVFAGEESDADRLLIDAVMHDFREAMCEHDLEKALRSFDRHYDALQERQAEIDACTPDTQWTSQELTPLYQCRYDLAVALYSLAEREMRKSHCDHKYINALINGIGSVCGAKTHAECVARKCGSQSATNLCVKIDNLQKRYAADWHGLRCLFEIVQEFSFNHAEVYANSSTVGLSEVLNMERVKHKYPVNFGRKANGGFVIAGFSVNGMRMQVSPLRAIETGDTAIDPFLRWASRRVESGDMIGSLLSSFPVAISNSIFSLSRALLEQRDHPLPFVWGMIGFEKVDFAQPYSVVQKIDDQDGGYGCLKLSLELSLVPTVEMEARHSVDKPRSRYKGMLESLTVDLYPYLGIVGKISARGEILGVGDSGTIACRGKGMNRVDLSFPMCFMVEYQVVVSDESYSHPIRGSEWKCYDLDGEFYLYTDEKEFELVQWLDVHDKVNAYLVEFGRLSDKGAHWAAQANDGAALTIERSDNCLVVSWDPPRGRKPLRMTLAE